MGASAGRAAQPGAGRFRRLPSTRGQTRFDGGRILGLEHLEVDVTVDVSDRRIPLEQGCDATACSGPRDYVAGDFCVPDAKGPRGVFKRES